VEKLSQDFVPRDYRHLSNLNKTADYIKDIFAAHGAVVYEQVYKVNSHSYRNIFANFGPEAGERVIVGAHYDAYDLFPAADDNASGVAGVLELARMLERVPVSVPITLAAYTLEEPPFFRKKQMGSYVHAKELSDSNAPVRLMISLEMIGYFSDEPGSQSYPVPGLRLLYSSTGNFIGVIGEFGFSTSSYFMKRSMMAVSDLPVYSLNGPRAIRGVDFSDHSPFWDHGFDAIMVTDTAFMRNTAYHTPDDQAHRLDYQRMAEVVNGVHYFLLNMDEND
jgi:Zn-dependent M28 family amino/carboxypeptidase